MGLSSILIVDDHDAVRQGIRALLAARADWFVCGEAVDGVEAVEKAKSLRPDVVLMDVSMPRMDGVQAAKILGREVPESEVVIVSENDRTIVRNQAREVGTAAFIAKSDLARELLPTLDRLAGLWRAKPTSKSEATI